MARLIIAILSVIVLGAVPVLAQPGHVVATPDALKWVVGMGEKFDQGSGKELPVGGFVAIPPKHPHLAGAGGQETVVQVHGVGPTDITFVNPADDPRKKQ